MSEAKFKTYIGAKSRGLKYTLADREDLEAMFPRAGGGASNLFELIQEHFVKPGSFAVQAAMLWKGLARVDSRVTLDKTKEWLEAEVEKGSALTPIFKAVIDAILDSGVLGFVIKVDLEDEAIAEKPESPKEPL